MREVHITMNVNGARHELTVPARESLLEIVRERLGLTGTKEGCGHGDCGACLVLMNGRLANACLVLAGDLDHAEIITVEGLAGEDGGLDALQQAFLDHGAVQCGYCTSGMLLSAKALLDSGKALDEDTVREGLAGVVCRCGTYPRVVETVLEAARARKEGQ